MTINSTTVIDEEMAEAIRAIVDDEISDLLTYDVLITEFDVENRTAKLRIVGDDARRIPATITDPVAAQIDNIYIEAFAHAHVLRIKAKASIRDDQLKHLHVMDAARPS